MTQLTSPNGRLHEEFGILPENAPCTNCFELIDQRTSTTREFLKADDLTYHYKQTGYSQLHMPNANGDWISITSSLKPTETAGIFKADHQYTPIEINTIQQMMKIENGEMNISFNNNLQLIHKKSDGTIIPKEFANWSNVTAGTDGIYVTDLFPGIDLVVTTRVGGIKSDFIIKNNLGITDGKLIIRDHLEVSSILESTELYGYTEGSNQLFTDLDFINPVDGSNYFTISQAIGYDDTYDKDHMQLFGYQLSANNELDLIIPLNWLNAPTTQYPVTIDPLVSTNTTLAGIGGSGYNAACFTGGCSYSMNANVPNNITITDVRWSFNYLAQGSCWLSDGAIDFNILGCRSPSSAGFYWFCNLNSPGTCSGSNISMFSHVSSCLPAPACVLTIPVTMNFYRCWSAGGGCSNACIGANSNWTMTIEGRTVEEPTVPTSSLGLTICNGDATTLTATSGFGVPPYTYNWVPGGAGNPIVVSP
ncbi:MAG: hypothetical protein JKY54_18560, partial [Flavobacteriales bacterium]|nr:hypothetical protein [Flavobacteriales bacterium]